MHLNPYMHIYKWETPPSIHVQGASVTDWEPIKAFESSLLSRAARLTRHHFQLLCVGRHYSCAIWEQKGERNSHVLLLGIP